MTDQDWIRRFEDASLPNDSFHHPDHVKMAFLYLQSYPPMEALSRFTAALKRFAQAHGKADRYHETITWAFLFLIRERLARSGQSCTWEDFIERNPDLLRWNPNILAKYYHPETLSSALAKAVFIFPDKL
jgi:hypothetical protein